MQDSKTRQAVQEPRKNVTGLDKLIGGISGCLSYLRFRKIATWVISRSIYAQIIVMQLAVYYRFYYLRDWTFTLECFLLALLCLAIDIVIWRAHWNMTYEDAGFVTDSPSIIKASNLS